MRLSRDGRRWRRGLCGLAAFCAPLLLMTAVAASPWSDEPGPSDGPARVIGSPAAGCLGGAVALPPEGEGYQVLRLNRNRNWGHPATVEFVTSLARHAAAEGFGPLLVGDMAQPRGGPLPAGHASHQSGLDVDIWLRLEGARLGDAEREAPRERSVVTRGHIDRAVWRPAHQRLLELAASDPAVDRIFVNPAIKAEVCRRASGHDWVRKLRPWWGHDAHFHVRLACPAGMTECVPQAPVPEGDGCGAELAGWLSPPPASPSGPDATAKRSVPVLPSACAAVRDGTGRGG